MATEEPDEGNLHVRICGEGAGEPVPLPGSRPLQTQWHLGAAPALVRSAPSHYSPNTARFIRSTTLRVWASVRWAYRFTIARVL